MKGRKTKYTPERIQKIMDLIQEDTFTIPEICERVGISEKTFHTWKNDKPQFLQDIKKAEELQLKNLTRIARNSMKKKLEGYDYIETKTVNKNIKSGVKTITHKDGSIEKIDIYKPIKIEETIITKHVTPSDTMIIFYMKNQDPENFGEEKEKDATEQKIVVKNGEITIE